MHYSILTKLSNWLLKNFEYCLNLNKKAEAVELANLGTYIHELLAGSGWISTPLAMQLMQGRSSRQFVEKIEKFGFCIDNSNL